MTVPMLDEMIQLAAANGAREVVIGMAHRGRLNVLAHNLGRAYETIFARVRGRLDARGRDHDPAGRHRRRQVPPRRAGHLPAAQRRVDPRPPGVQPVAPRVRRARSSSGATRAAQTTRQGPHAHLRPNAAVPIVLHGDAAFPGQGVVAESLNLQALDGYKVGGTLHLIQNNQVGFTTDPDDSRSTRWASDLAKGFDVPIIHVNADDVAACISAVRLAFAFRQEFGHDVADRPDRLPPLRPQRGRRARLHAARDVRQDQGQEAGRASSSPSSSSPTASSPRRRPTRSQQEIWDDLAAPPPGAQGASSRSADDRAADRRVPARPLAVARGQDRGLGRPAARAQRGAAARSPRASPSTPSSSSSSSAGATAVGPEGGIDWAHAESLAFASLLTEGMPIRLTGQDAERGTFSQRHLVLHDAKTGQRSRRSRTCRARWRRWSCTTRR